FCQILRSVSFGPNVWCCQAHEVQGLPKKGFNMKIKPTPKHGGVLLELGPQEAQIPVQGPSVTAVFKLQKILVPVDFSDCSKKSLQYAVAFANDFGAARKRLQVVEPYPAVPEMAPYDVETIAEGKGQLELLQKSIGAGLRSSTSLRTGAAYFEIAEAASEF